MENRLAKEKALNNQITISSLEVAEMLGKEHHKLLRDIRTYVDNLGQSNLGYSDFFIESSYINRQNKTQPCYELTRKGCEFVGNKMTGEKGTIFTVMYINKFHEMEEELNVTPLHRDSYTIEDPIKRAKAWIVEEEKRQLLEREREELKAKMLIDKPKTDLGGAIIERGENCLVKQLAIMITQTGKVKVGQNKLFEWLRAEGYLCKQGNNRNLPTQRAIGAGLFEVKVSTRVSYNEIGEEVQLPNKPTTMVTPKGQAHFVGKAIQGCLNIA